MAHRIANRLIEQVEIVVGEIDARGVRREDVVHRLAQGEGTAKSASSSRRATSGRVYQPFGLVTGQGAGLEAPRDQLLVAGQLVVGASGSLRGRVGEVQA